MSPFIRRGDIIRRYQRWVKVPGTTPYWKAWYSQYFFLLKFFCRYIESNTGKSPRQGVGDFSVLYFLPVFDFISHFYQLFIVSCLFDDHVDNVSYFPFIVNQKSSFLFLCIAWRLLCNNMANC